MGSGLGLGCQIELSTGRSTDRSINRSGTQSCCWWFVWFDWLDRSQISWSLGRWIDWAIDWSKEPDHCGADAADIGRAPSDQTTDCGSFWVPNERCASADWRRRFSKASSEASNMRCDESIDWLDRLIGCGCPRNIVWAARWFMIDWLFNWPVDWLDCGNPKCLTPPMSPTWGIWWWMGCEWLIAWPAVWLEGWLMDCWFMTCWLIDDWLMARCWP